MLDQRRRRWADVVKMSYKCFVFAWLLCLTIIIININKSHIIIMVFQPWYTAKHLALIVYFVTGYILNHKPSPGGMH